MQATIKRGERTKGSMLTGKSVEVYLWCRIDLTPEEKALFNQTGNPIRLLATPYGEFDNDAEMERAGIRTFPAMNEGSEMVVANYGQLKEKEQELIENLKAIQGVLDNIRDYEAEAEYTIDLENMDEGD